MIHKENLLSILIPAYNRPKELERCINSLITYKGDDIEIIVQDDCSPLHLQETVERINDPRIKYFRNPTNIGLSPNFIDILNRASGKYVYYITDDDYLFPDAIQKIKKFIIYHKPIAFTSDIFTYYEKSHAIRNESAFRYDIDADFDALKNNAKIILSVGILTRFCFDISKLDMSFLKLHGGIWFPQIIMIGSLLPKGKLCYMASPVGIHTWENEVFWDIKSNDVVNEFDDSRADTILNLSELLTPIQLKEIIKLFIVQSYTKRGINKKFYPYLSKTELISLSIKGYIKSTLISIKDKIIYNLDKTLNHKKTRK